MTDERQIADMMKLLSSRIGESAGRINAELDAIFRATAELRNAALHIDLQEEKP